MANCELQVASRRTLKQEAARAATTPNRCLWKSISCRLQALFVGPQEAEAEEEEEEEEELAALNCN